MYSVLVVDDDPDFVEITRTILSQAGYRVLTAADGQQALDIMCQEAPDVVLLDIMMRTVLEGLNVSHAIQENPALKNTRVVMVTSIMDTDKAALFPTDEYVPVDAWLAKPVQPQQLLDTVAKYCSRAKK